MGCSWWHCIVFMSIVIFFFTYVSMLSSIQSILLFIRLVEVFRLPITPEYVKRYVMDVVKQTVEYRSKEEKPRQDLMQFLIDLSDSQAHDQNEKIELIASQVVLFYLAGVDTSSSGIAYCLFELAKNPELKQKLHDEVDAVMAKYNNQVTYESLQEMPYLDLCIKGMHFIYKKNLIMSLYNIQLYF